MRSPAAKAGVTWRAAYGRAELDGDSLEARWRRRLETASNLVCRSDGNPVATASVVLPLAGEDGEVERLESVGRRLAAERKLTCRTRVGTHTITIAFSNEV